MTSYLSEKLVHEAIKDPYKHFHAPAEVAKDIRLSVEQKQKILDNWALDQNRLLNSEAENMGDNRASGRAANLLQNIHKAKDMLH